MCLPERLPPTEKEWIHAGLRCAIVKQPNRYRCGYVRIPANHPFFSIENYEDIPVDVHGGFTFAQIEPCEHEDGKGLWVGFDFAHCFDAMYEPGNEPEHVVQMRRELGHALRDPNEHFWSLEEVVAETERCAAQIAAAHQIQMSESSISVG